MIVEVVRFKDGISMQRYACRITDNGKVRYCRIHTGVATYYELDEFGVVPNNVLTSFQAANGCKEVLDNLCDRQAEVVTPEMIKTESLLGMHEDSLVMDNGPEDHRLQIDPNYFARANIASSTHEALLRNSIYRDKSIPSVFDPGNL